MIPKHGGYRRLKSFQVAQLVYDVTVRFCDRFIDRRSRTHDQMVQAARSGVQNIAEGSMASGTSKKTELKLTNVARASLEELRLDYEDFLRQRELREWQPDDPRRGRLVARRCATADEVALWVKQIVDEGSAGRPDERNGLDGRDGPDGQSIPSISSTPSIPSIPSTPSAKRLPAAVLYSEAAANAALVLIGVAVSLLDRQIASQAADFEREGGFTERLYRVRQARRRQP
ncbi:MAG: four helix bundle protein [Pirellulaceae bacterium]|nr:four helix bundle protein [Pirellulaceae bacterium]